MTRSPRTIRADGVPPSARPFGRLWARNLLPLLLLASGCGGEERATGPLPKAMDPREAALALFQAAQIGRDSPEDFNALIRPRESARDRAALTDLLTALRGTTRARILGHQQIDAERDAVDLEVGLPGGGSAEYTVHTAREEDGSWRVSAILGPETAWPPAPPASGEGLSSGGHP